MLETIFKLLERYGDMFIEGIGYTLLLSAIAVLVGLPIGAIVAIMRMSKFKNPILNKYNPLRWISIVYVEVLRGTPLLLQLYFFYFMLPDMIPFVKMSDFTCVSVALLINSSAYVSEVIRSGIQAIDRGQTEAARSLGLNGTQTMIIKETSLASTFFIGDIMTQYNTIRGITYRVVEPLIIVAVIYLVITFTLSKLVAIIERRMKAGD